MSKRDLNNNSCGQFGKFEKPQDGEQIFRCQREQQRSVRESASSSEEVIHGKDGKANQKIANGNTLCVCVCVCVVK